MTTCRLCGQPITWATTAARKKTPVNPDGSTHWATCPRRDALRPRRRLATATTPPLLDELSRCASCGQVRAWRAGQLIDKDGALHRLTCDQLPGTPRQLRQHAHACDNCQGLRRCNVITDSRDELHRCLGCHTPRVLNRA